MERRGWRRTAAYVGLLGAAFVVAVAGSWALGSTLDNAAYDFMFRLYQPQPWQTQSVLLSIDEPTLAATPGGMHGIRRKLAEALELVARAKPKVVAVDMILADQSEDPAVDRALAGALCGTPNLVLSSELIKDGTEWEDPRPEFRKCAAAIGHVHARPDPADSRTRAIPLVKRTGHDQRYALSLQAFALSRGAKITLLSDSYDVEVGNATIPVEGSPRLSRRIGESNEFRLMRVRFIPANMQPIQRISVQDLILHPDLARAFSGKVVFVGVIAPTAEIRDRLLTPTSPDVYVTGIEINAEAFETMNQGQFLTNAGDLWVVLFSLALAAMAGLAFRYLPGWRAYGAGVAIFLASQVVPYLLFRKRVVFPLAMPTAASALTTMAAAAYYHLVVRRNWLVEQSARERYQQAMHFVTHEMRTPLATIQGSSELLSRYALNEEKRKHFAVTINSESKRVARMLEIFLNVERLSAGQMQLKRESISVKQMVEVCVERIKVLADRKHIGVTLVPVDEALQLTGDRELMEYACYNLLTNAVKYSPQKTEVTVSVWQEGGNVRIAVKDQGIGMDQKEVKQIFQKFYRTIKAEESGEAGTGIGLSLVQQIVEQHGGKIGVTSQPGTGSCFTIVVPAAAMNDRPTAAERH
ncbi:MAG TPA: CHASE2 domain-containing protein [Bryobacteraceae bacterium]|nr:CHASE2 domain-containing protein [Bryobacteraceae bacterium]